MLFDIVLGLIYSLERFVVGDYEVMKAFCVKFFKLS